MKRILLLLALGFSVASSQVRLVPWSKASDDTAKVAGPNWGIKVYFVTFPDGSKMLTAAALSDTSKYVEKLDSLVASGYATRTMLQADSNYARSLFARDTTYRKAQEDAIRAIQAADSAYKADQLLLRWLKSDSASTPGVPTINRMLDSLSDVRTTINANRYWTRNSTAPQSGTISPATATDTIKGTVALFSGNSGFGTTTPTARVDINGTAQASHYYLAGASPRKITTATTNADLAFYYWTGAAESEWMRLHATTGNVGIGTTGPLTKLDVTGRIRSTDTLRVGDWTTYSYFIPGGALVQSSDESLKANIVPFTANLANFKNVSPRTYTFKKELFLQTFDRNSVPDSADVRVDSVTTKRVSNLARKDSIATAFYVQNLADAERKSKIAYRGFLANEFNPLMLGKESKEINQQDVINVMWLKIQELERRIEKLEGK